MNNSLPARWTEYSKMGKLIPDTRIIVFKTPLRKEICKHLSNIELSFTTEDLIDKGKEINLSLVIDLTMSVRFYCSEDLKENGIEYFKLKMRGGGSIPRQFEVYKFCSIVNNHLKRNPNGVVGVHCTHGLNRTGYLVCCYMVDCLGFSASYAVELFEECRGHEIDRANYRSSLLDRSEPVTNSIDMCHSEIKDDAKCGTNSNCSNRKKRPRKEKNKVKEANTKF